MEPNLTFRFRNIGPVDDAKIELGSLTIISGRNNTGKTYLVYAIYGFLRKTWALMPTTTDSPYLDDHISEMTSLTKSEIATRLIEGGRIEWENDRDVVKHLQTKLLHGMCLRYSESGLAEVFNTSTEHFQETSMSLEFNSDSNTRGATGIPNEKTILWCDFEGTKIGVTLKRLEPDEEIDFDHEFIYPMMKDAYIRALLFELTSFRRSIHILSSVRHAISMFYKELDNSRSKMVRTLQQVEDDQSGMSPQIRELLRQTSRYALPIQDNIDFAREIPKLKLNTHRNDALVDIANMLGGRLEVMDEDVRFISKESKSRGYDIPLYLASSSTSELTHLYFYLSQLAEHEDYFLIVDEPESHLDTANQIQFARLLARLVASGARVLITTHSDYIIKEINNLIMLNSQFEDKEEFMERRGYRNSLDPTLVRAYVAEDNSLDRCKIDQYGIDMPVFDRTIDEINIVANELASRLAIELEEE